MVVVAAGKMIGDPTGEGEEDVKLEEGEEDTEDVIAVGLIDAKEMGGHFVAGFGILICGILGREDRNLCC